MQWRIKKPCLSLREKSVATYLHTVCLVANYFKEMNTAISVTTYKKVPFQSSCRSPLFLAFWKFKLIHLL